MGKKLNVPSITGLNIEGIPFGVIVFLQAVQDALNTVDSNVAYKDDITVSVPATRIRARSAQGQTFTVSGTNLASGDDYLVLVRDFQTLLEDHNALRQTVADLRNQIKGS